MLLGVTRCFFSSVKKETVYEYLEEDHDNHSPIENNSPIDNNPTSNNPPNQTISQPTAEVLS